MPLKAEDHSASPRETIWTNLELRFAYCGALSPSESTLPTAHPKSFRAAEALQKKFFDLPQATKDKLRLSPESRSEINEKKRRLGFCSRFFCSNLNGGLLDVVIV